MSVVEECSYNVLGAFDFFLCQWGRVILLHPLNFCAILDGCGFVEGNAVVLVGADAGIL